MLQANGIETSVRPNGTPVMPVLRSRSTVKLSQQSTLTAVLTRTVRTDRPYRRSVRTVRTDRPYGPSVRTVPVPVPPVPVPNPGSGSGSTGSGCNLRFHRFRRICSGSPVPGSIRTLPEGAAKKGQGTVKGREGRPGQARAGEGRLCTGTVL